MPERPYLPQPGEWPAVLGAMLLLGVVFCFLVGLVGS